MSSKINFAILRHQLNLAHTIICIPLKWSTSNTVEIDTSKTKSAIFASWLIFNCLVYINSLVRFYFMMTSENVSEALKLVHVIFVLMFHNGTCYLLNFKFCNEELTALINNFWRFGVRERMLFGSRLQSFRWRPFENIVIHLVALTCLLVPLILPMVTLVWPCEHQLWTRLLCNSNLCGSWPCSWWVFKVVIYILEGIACAPCFFLGGPLGTIALISLASVIKNLKAIQHISKQSGLTIGEQYRLASFYLKLQIFSDFVNKALQKYFMPLLQFSGSGWIIACLYSVIQYWNELPAYINGFVVFYALIVTLFVGSLLDYASRTISISQLIIAPWKKTRGRKHWRFRRSKQNKISVFH